jgi:hypothetical protein
MEDARRRGIDSLVEHLSAQQFELTMEEPRYDPGQRLDLGARVAELATELGIRSQGGQEDPVDIWCPGKLAEEGGAEKRRHLHAIRKCVEDA